MYGFAIRDGSLSGESRIVRSEASNVPVRDDETCYFMEAERRAGELRDKMTKAKGLLAKGFTGAKATARAYHVTRHTVTLNPVRGAGWYLSTPRRVARGACGAQGATC
jgi:hypothetical protein